MSTLRSKMKNYKDIKYKDNKSKSIIKNNPIPLSLQPRHKRIVTHQCYKCKRFISIKGYANYKSKPGHYGKHLTCPHCGAQ
jgi:hypothetical protein